MRVGAGCYFLAATVCTTLWIFSASGLAAQDAHFHNAPTSSSQQKNPYAGRRQPSRQAQNSMRRIAARVTESMDAAPGTFQLWPEVRLKERPTERFSGLSRPARSITVCRLGQPSPSQNDGRSLLT